MINKLVIDTLKPLGIPVGFQKYSGADTTYITFHEYLQTGEEFEEDEEAFTGHYVQVDIWSKADYTSYRKYKNAAHCGGLQKTDEAVFTNRIRGSIIRDLNFIYLESKEVD